MYTVLLYWHNRYMVALLDNGGPHCLSSLEHSVILSWYLPTLIYVTIRTSGGVLFPHTSAIASVFDNNTTTNVGETRLYRTMQRGLSS